MDYFHTHCPALEGLKDGGNEAEWIVDLTTQADRQGRTGDFAASYAKSELKTAAEKEIEQQLAGHSDLGARQKWRCWLLLDPVWVALKAVRGAIFNAACSSLTGNPSPRCCHPAGTTSQMMRPALTWR